MTLQLEESFTRSLELDIDVLALQETKRPLNDVLTRNGYKFVFASDAVTVKRRDTSENHFPNRANKGRKKNGRAIKHSNGGKGKGKGKAKSRTKPKNMEKAKERNSMNTPNTMVSAWRTNSPLNNSGNSIRKPVVRKFQYSLLHVEAPLNSSTFMRHRAEDLQMKGSSSLTNSKQPSKHRNTT